METFKNLTIERNEDRFIIKSGNELLNEGGETLTEVYLDSLLEMQVISLPQYRRLNWRFNQLMD